MRLTTSIERIIKCYPPGDYLQTICAHYKQHQRIDFADLVETIGPSEAFWSLRAVREHCTEISQQIALGLALSVSAGHTLRVPCEQLITETLAQINGHGDNRKYVATSEAIMGLESLYDDPITRAMLMCVTASSCVINPPLIADSVWLTVKYAELVLGEYEVKRIVLEYLG